MEALTRSPSIDWPLQIAYKPSIGINAPEDYLVVTVSTHQLDHEDIAKKFAVNAPLVPEILGLPVAVVNQGVWAIPLKYIADVFTAQSLIICS